MTEITGKTLIAWGFKPGSWFGEAIEVANYMWTNGESEPAIRTQLQLMQPPPPLPLQKSILPHMNMDPGTNDAERTNYASVFRTMQIVTRTPTVRRAAIMPDACPAGPPGTIPVGGIVATENAIHPGMHSADICCSVALSNLGDVDPKKVMDEAFQSTHFGGGGRHKSDLYVLSSVLLQEFKNNPFLHHLEDVAVEHMGTQGDGNHFLFVGRLASTGETCVVTHHGSRKPGAMLYKRGMRCAEKYRQKLSPDTLKQNAWIPADTQDGEDYWNALGTIRQWTKANHMSLHRSLGFPTKYSYWNEHNFVFFRDGLFFHGKGATPGWDTYANDASGFTLVPLNMAEPILITLGRDAPHGLGFLPHGAGRNFSRTQHRKLQTRTIEETVASETEGLDVRFFSGYPDISELPSAYKNADSVIDQIKRYQLATVTDVVEPYGCIMAGEWRKAFS